MAKNSSKTPVKTAKTAALKGEAQPIRKEMTLGEVVQKYPSAAFVMMNYGLHCIGCHVSAWETVEQGALGHGLSPKQLDEMLAEMNAIAREGVNNHGLKPVASLFQSGSRHGSHLANSGRSSHGLKAAASATRGCSVKGAKKSIA